MGVYLPLPSEYQEVDYIQSSGTQYIDTGISVGTSANGEIIEGKIQFNSNTSSQVNGKNKKSALFFGTNTSNEFYASSGNSGTWGATSVTNDYKPHIFKIAQSETKLYIDGTGYSFSGGTLQDSSTTNIYIGACSDAGNTNYFCKENIYRFRIWRNGTLLKDFIPCYRKSDNVIGLYDLVNNQFYTNSGTGTFSKGADVTAVPLKNAYIGGYYEYSYDFIGKTTTQLTNDGWVTTKGTPSINSNGLYYGGSAVNIIKSIGTVLSSAKKIIYKFNGRHGNSGAADLNYSTMTWGGGTTYNNATGVYNSYSTYNKYLKGGTSINFTHTPSGGALSYTYTVDLVNKTINLTYTSGSSSTFNWSLTDAEIANIRINDYIFLSLNGSNEAVGSISLTVEY